MNNVWPHVVTLLDDTPYDCTLVDLDSDARTLFTVRTQADDAPTATVVEPVWRMTFDDPMVASYRAERIDVCDALHHARFCPGVAERMEALGL